MNQEQSGYTAMMEQNYPNGYRPQETERKTMDSFTIDKCRLCGKIMKFYGMMVYPGDSSCCQECNDKARESTD